MKSYSLLSIFLFVILIVFTSCVSKKKYAALQTENLKEISDNNRRNEARLTKAGEIHDSLKVELVKRDSIIDSLTLKIAEFQSKKDKPKVYSSKKSNIPKEQEYETKSQFIYNFAAYIEWPVIYNGTEFVIGVAGDQNAVDKMKAIIGNKKVGGKKLRIEKYNKVTNYHVVYVTSANSNNFTTIKNDSKKNKTILVSDDDDLFAQGAHISFIINDNKVKYTINKPVIEKIGLRVSQELMRFSE